MNSDSSNKLSGRVELYHDGSWGTICDDNWDLNDAQVVCRQLGFPPASRAIGGASFGQGSGNILLDDVNCNGEEECIENCVSTGFRNHNCDHSKVLLGDTLAYLPQGSHCLFWFIYLS